MSGQFTHRLAEPVDLPALEQLMQLSIRRLIGEYFDDLRLEASFEIMGLDTGLIRDRTYFVIESGQRIVGGGGWSRRATMFGGDHTSGRDDRLLDPKIEPARIRAMYTHPDFVRRGIGRLVLEQCEEAAEREGFGSLELVATVAGEPFYLSAGYIVTERFDVPTSLGVSVPCARMMKDLKISRV
ncbi:MAG: GNAT family N-acetyltransferase [Gemmatimonadota bacterium]